MLIAAQLFPTGTVSDDNNNMKSKQIHLQSKDFPEQDDNKLKNKLQHDFLTV